MVKRAPRGPTSSVTLHFDPSFCPAGFGITVRTKIRGHRESNTDGAHLLPTKRVLIMAKLNLVQRCLEPKGWQNHFSNADKDQ